MNKITFLSVPLAVLIIPITLTFGEELKPIPLLKPQRDIGRPRMSTCSALPKALRLLYADQLTGRLWQRR